MLCFVSRAVLFLLCDRNFIFYLYDWVWASLNIVQPPCEELIFIHDSILSCIFYERRWHTHSCHVFICARHFTLAYIDLVLTLFLTLLLTLVLTLFLTHTPSLTLSYLPWSLTRLCPLPASSSIIVYPSCVIPRPPSSSPCPSTLPYPYSYP